MADVQNPVAKSGGADVLDVARAAPEIGARQVKEGARVAEAVADKTAEATRAATKANADFLRTQIEATQQAVRSSLEAGISSFDGISQNLNRVFGVATPDRDLAEKSAQNIQAVSRASSELAKGAHAVARAWFEAPQMAARTHLEAFSQLASCRSVQEVVTLQSNLLRDGLQQAIERGDAIARAHANAIQAATQAIQPRSRPAA